MKWTKGNGKNALTINMDMDVLVAEIDRQIAHFQDVIKKIEKGEEDEDRYERGRLYGDPENDFLEPDRCIKDLEETKKRIMEMAEDVEGNTIWPMAVFKKNGTFKRTVKPIIYMQEFGSYWEDSYGWNVQVLRLEPMDDMNAEIVLRDIVEHY